MQSSRQGSCGTRGQAQQLHPTRVRLVHILGLRSVIPSISLLLRPPPPPHLLCLRFVLFSSLFLFSSSSKSLLDCESRTPIIQSRILPQPLVTCGEAFQNSTGCPAPLSRTPSTSYSRHFGPRPKASGISPSIRYPACVAVAISQGKNPHFCATLHAAPAILLPCLPTTTSSTGLGANHHTRCRKKTETFGITISLRLQPKSPTGVSNPQKLGETQSLIQRSWGNLLCP